MPDSTQPISRRDSRQKESKEDKGMTQKESTAAQTDTLPIYDVKITLWVEVAAKDQWMAREIAADRMMNGGYNASFEADAEIESAERREP
jgi:hypothetical protein